MELQVGEDCKSDVREDCKSDGLHIEYIALASNLISSNGLETDSNGLQPSSTGHQCNMASNLIAMASISNREIGTTGFFQMMVKGVRVPVQPGVLPTPPLKMGLHGSVLEMLRLLSSQGPLFISW